VREPDFFHVYFHCKDKEKHIGDAKFGNDVLFSAISASSTFGSKGVRIFLKIIKNYYRKGIKKYMLQSSRRGLG